MADTDEDTAAAEVAKKEKKFTVGELWVTSDAIYALQVAKISKWDLVAFHEETDPPTHKSEIVSTHKVGEMQFTVITNADKTRTTVDITRPERPPPAAA